MNHSMALVAWDSLLAVAPLASSAKTSKGNQRSLQSVQSSTKQMAVETLNLPNGFRVPQVEVLEPIGPSAIATYLSIEFFNASANDEGGNATLCPSLKKVSRNNSF